MNIKHYLMRHSLGTVLAILHIALFATFLSHYEVIADRDGQAMLLWMYWLPVDFPISLVLMMGWWVLDPNTACGEAAGYYLLYVVHGVLGPIWWFYLPSLVVGVARKLGFRKSGMPPAP